MSLHQLIPLPLSGREFEILGHITTGRKNELYNGTPVGTYSHIPVLRIRLGFQLQSLTRA